MSRSSGDTLSPDQARQLLRDQQRVDAAAALLEQAKAARARTRERLSVRVPVGEALTTAGIRVKRTVKSSGSRFKLGDFLAKYELTKEMRRFVTKPTTYEHWSVSELEAETK